MGVKWHPAQFSTVVNALPQPNQRFSRTEVVEALRADYMFFDQLFEKQLPASWRIDAAALKETETGAC